MSANLTFGRYRILARTAGLRRPAGIERGEKPFQEVRIDEPIQRWYLKGSYKTSLYRFTVGGYCHTGVKNGRVIVSDDQKEVVWYINYRGSYGAYTIEMASDRNRVWTVSAEDSENPHIVIKGVEKDFAGQLFLFEPADE